MNWISEIVGKISLEMILAEPGKDSGLLPVNCLLGELKERAAGLPSAIAVAVERAIAVVDRVLDSTGAFDADSIRELSDWAGWMNSAVLEAMSGRPPEPPAASNELEAVVAGPAIEPGLLLDLERDGELLAEFCTESREHLQNIEQGLLVLEREPADAETLNSVFRAFHTFKGSAGFLNLHPIKQLAHDLETVLDMARNGSLTVNKEIIDLILAGGDILKDFVREIDGRLGGRQGNEPIRIPILGLLRQVRRITSSRDSVSSSDRKLKPSPNGTSNPSPASLFAGEEFPKSVPRNPAGAKRGRTATVNVDASRLESLMELVGELAVAQSQVCQDPDVPAIKSERLNGNLARLTRITGELQRNAISLSMVSVRATFQKMTRVVRDVSGRQGKQVALCLHGEDTELDRGIVEEIGDPLIHMIRNSVDHGIELPGERINAGKPPIGTIHLSAFHRGGNVIIQIRDDGRGLDAEKIRARAIENGMISPSECLTGDETRRLIFTTGLSTSDAVTEISGRGVGMDVVRRNIERLRGRIEIESTKGRGTTFTISLPLTLAIIDGLVVAIGEQRFILPTLAVRECLRPTKEMLATAPANGETVNLRGQCIPLLRMYEFYEINPRATDPTQALVVVIENGGEACGLMVDELIGRQEVVIKGLGETFQNAPAIAGGAILGDGRVALILDAHALVGRRNWSGEIAA